MAGMLWREERVPEPRRFLQGLHSPEGPQIKFSRYRRGKDEDATNISADHPKQVDTSQARGEKSGTRRNISMIALPTASDEKVIWGMNFTLKKFILEASGGGKN